MRFTLRHTLLVLLVSAVGGFESVRADSLDDQFAVAAGHYGQERWQEACEAFEKMLATHPDHKRANQARFFYGEALAQLNRPEEARRQFAELLRRDPDHRYARQALFRSGEAAYLAGDAAAARRDLQEFRQRYGQDALCGYVLPYLASLELQSGNAVAAEPLFAEALAKFETGPLADECRLGLARAQEQTGRLDDARRGYRALADGRGPLADQAAHYLGTLENAQGEHASALETLDRLANSSSVDALLRDKARLGRGYALLKLGREAEADTALAGLLEHPSLRVEAHYWLGLSQKQRKQWDTAAKTLTAGAKIDPRHRLNPALEFQAGDALVQTGDHAAACDRFERALERWPDGPWADDCLYGKLRVAALRGENAPCVQLADELAAKFPDSPLRPAAELAKGRALLALGQYAPALATINHLLERPPSSLAGLGDDDRAHGRSVVALCHARLGRFEEAQAALAQVSVEKADGPWAAETRYQVAELAFAAGKFAIAGELFSQMVDANGTSESVRRGLLGLAWCQFQTDQWAAAAETFRRLLDQYPDHATAAEAALMCGRALEHLDQQEPALTMYRALVDRYGASDRAAEALWRAAQLHEKRQEPRQAMELYGKLVQSHPEFSQRDGAIFRRACLLEQAGDRAGAAELLTQLRRDFPHSRYLTDAMLRQAEHALAGQKFDEAHNLLHEVAQLPPNDAALEQTLYLQGRVALAREQWDAAELSLAQLVERFPTGALVSRAQYLMAEASFRQGKYDQAARRLADLAATTGDHAEPWSAMAELRRAQSLVELKEWSDVLEVARQIGGRFPNFEHQHEVDYLVGRALAAQADMNGAREAYARVVASPRGGNTQTAAMAQWMIGESYFHQENYRAALAEYAKVDARYPFARWQAAALLQRGKCHELLGQWPAAVEAYERLLQQHPAGDFSAEARERLAAAQQRIAGKSSKLN